MVVFIEGVVICRFKVKIINKVDVLSGKGGTLLVLLEMCLMVCFYKLEP